MNILTLSTANVVPSSLIRFTLLMEATHASETSVLTKAMRPNIREDDILYSHRRGYLKSDSINRLGSVAET
jgi:hypothetical protein